MYKDDDVGQAQFVKEKVRNDLWWDKINYIFAFTEPIYDMISVTDTDKPSLHLAYDMRDTTIKKVKSVIYWHEEKRENEQSFFMMLCIKSWRIDGTKLTCHFNVWHTL